MLRLHLGANLVGSTITTARMPRHKRRGDGRAHSLVLAPNGRKRIRQAYATIDGIGVSNNPKKMEPAVPPPTTAAVTTDRSITALRFRTRSRSFALRWMPWGVQLAVSILAAIQVLAASFVTLAPRTVCNKGQQFCTACSSECIP